MIAFSVGPIDIYWYGMFYLIGFLIGYLVLRLIGKYSFFHKLSGLQKLLKNNTDDILIAIILGVIIGGRLGEVLIYQWEYFSNNLLQIFAIWNGGMSFIGGIIGVFISLIILKFIKKLTYIEFWLLIDCILVFVPIAIFFGRFGNYLNQELYGFLVPNNFWGLNDFIVNTFLNLNIFHVYSKVDDLLRINTNFISMIFEGIILFIILFSVFIRNIKIKTIKPGFIVGLFLVFYSFFRFFIEYLRIDSQSQFVGLFTKSQWVFILFIILGFIFLFNKKIKLIKL